MINLDKPLIDFISTNWFSLSLAIGTLKIIARMTPWSHDDSIMELISGLFNQIRGGKK
jgi:hypothetical protein